VAGKIESLRAIVYLVVQLAGAATGAAMLRAVFRETVWRGTSLGATLVNHQVMTNGKAVLLEAVLTFFLVFTVFATAIDDRGAFKSIAGFGIGLIVTVDILIGGPLTGAAMNPARWFGPAVASGYLDNWYVYWIGPFIGAAVAGLSYRYVFGPSEEREPIVLPDDPRAVPSSGPRL